jgi:enoyl-CoA hydratase
MSEVQVSRSGSLGILTLDRPKALNALTRSMVAVMSAQLAAWRDDPEVAAVLVKAVPGRAFCAGGDVRAVVLTAREQGVEAALPFFHDEYRLNWRIRNLGKPYIAFMDGVTMGGGVGISIHGTHRIATEHTLFAMPETGIGFFPDVGGSFFLPRLPGEIGTWLGLTGAHLHGADCLAAGVATHFVPSERLAELEGRLSRGVDRAFDGVVAQPANAGITALHGRIDASYRGGDLTSLLAALESEPTGWGAEQAALLRTKSPLAVVLSLAMLRLGRDMSLEECLRLEYRAVRHILESGEFHEGVRALLIDKDRRPRWLHQSLEEVPAALVARIMAPDGLQDLPLDWA